MLSILVDKLHGLIKVKRDKKFKHIVTKDYKPYFVNIFHIPIVDARNRNGLKISRIYSSLKFVFQRGWILPPNLGYSYISIFKVNGRTTVITDDR